MAAGGPAWAGFHSTASFVPPGAFSLGFEPELVLTQPASMGFNLKYTHGISDITNLGLIIGSGGGDRGFRLGGQGIFDFFPDTESQPGLGMAVQGTYIRGVNSGRFETFFQPYFHKSFHGKGGTEYDPFVAVPFGFGLGGDGDYSGMASLVLGSAIRLSDTVKATVELGVAINRTQSYFSTGVVYSR
ncbi:MAG: hypothetical protein AB7P04_13840 [Bacteriovoracia bacterium]